MKKAVILLLVLSLLFTSVFSYSLFDVNAASSEQTGKWVYKQTKSGKSKKHAYKYSDGSVPSGVVRVKDKMYYFDSKGVLKKSSKAHRIIKCRGRLYYINSNAVAESGYVIHRDKLYYFSKKYFRAVTNKKIGKYFFGVDGAALETLDVKLKIQCRDVLDDICSEDDSDYAKLRAAFDYMTSKSRFSYAGKYPDLDDDDWAKSLASDMLETHSGNCFGFACAFAALAREIGFDPIVITGRIHGSRDGEADGFTRHSLVMIGGEYYDPEITWVGNSTYYGTDYCPFVMKSREDHWFRGFDGTELADGKSANLVKNKMVLKNGYYHYYDKNGKELYGIYLIKKKVYVFHPGVGMPKKELDMWQKLTKAKAPYKAFADKVSKPRRMSSSASCYGSEYTDNVYEYKYVKVFTTKNNLTGEELITAISTKK